MITPSFSRLAWLLSVLALGGCGKPAASRPGLAQPVPLPADLALRRPWWSLGVAFISANLLC